MPGPVFANVIRAAESDSDKTKAAGTRSTITVMETGYALLLLVCGLGAYIAAHFASLRGGDLVRLGLILFSPFAFLMVGVALAQMSLVGYDAHCDGDCSGNLALPVVVAVAWIGTEVGAFAGWIHSAVSR